MIFFCTYKEKKMTFERTMGPIPERLIDQAITRDTELDWTRILNKPSTFTPSSHEHSGLTSLSCYQSSANVSPNSIISQPAIKSQLEIMSDKNNNAPSFITFHIPNVIASFVGLDTDGYFTFGGWSYSGRYAPIRTGHIELIGVNSNDASLRITNNTKNSGNQIRRWVAFNTKSNDATYPALGGLHFYGYNFNNTIVINPFSILDDGTIVVNYKIRFADGSEQIKGYQNIDPWFLPTLPSTNPLFSHYGAATIEQHFIRKNVFANSVDFIGSLLNNSAYTANTDRLAYILPVGYRPNKNRYFPIVVNNTFGHATINSLGEVYLRCGQNLNISSSWSLEFTMNL